MNVALHPPPAPMTTEAFLAWPGDGSGRRFNLVDGVARPMSPASHTHAQVQSNALALIARSIDAAGWIYLPWSRVRSFPTCIRRGMSGFQTLS